MKIILDEVKKEGVLIKEDGTEVSRYSYKNLVNDSYTLEDLKRDNEDFNATLSLQEDFDDIKKLSEVIKLHNWS